MKNLLRGFAHGIPALILPVLVAGMLLPSGVLASKQITIDWKGRDGDPIDGNDFSSGGSGGGGDIFHRDTSAVGSGAFDGAGLWVLPLSLNGQRIMIVPRMEAGVFMVRFVMLPAAEAQAEAHHVR